MSLEAKIDLAIFCLLIVWWQMDRWGVYFRKPK